MNRDVVEYWFAHYTEKQACSLCGNTGVIDTTGIRTPAGMEVGRTNFCICPNGQTLRTQYKDPPEPGAPLFNPRRKTNV